MAEKCDWPLRSGQYLGEISALCFLRLPPQFSYLPYLLAGSGCQILLYRLEEEKIIRSFSVFKGIRVHGISCDSVKSIQGSLSLIPSFNIAVYGERKLKLFNLLVEKRFDSQVNSEVQAELSLLCTLPNLSHWILDVCFLKDQNYLISMHEGSSYLAIGCSDNSVCVWDMLKSNMILKVASPEKCLLYSMRLCGKNCEALLIASGTIYNEIIVWKIVPQNYSSFVTALVKSDATLNTSFYKSLQLQNQQYKPVHICRLSGHKGSIFRIAWSSNGFNLVSASDDRCARIWAIHPKGNDSDDSMEVACSRKAGPVLFGHNARVWDCCMFDNLIITAGEDCTCRVWNLKGNQLKMIKEHIGRGIWRCLYDPKSALLITAGFDASIKVHHLHASLPSTLDGHVTEAKEFTDKSEVFTLHIPNSSEHTRLMDSKSEYVRCLHFVNEDTLYVATNNGYIYQVKVSGAAEWTWFELVRVSKEVPIICLDLLSRWHSELSNGIEDWLAIGDGKGFMTVARVEDNGFTPKLRPALTWLAERERQLLGTYWCKLLGDRYIFTADPRGMLKLWKFCDPSQFIFQDSSSSCSVSLVAEFTSGLGIRIMCLDASLEEEVLVCGDLRGNLILFPLLKSLLGTSYAADVKISPLNYFKGAHGISTVSSLSIARFNSRHIEIRSTGADGCICYIEYDKDEKKLEFIGMKQVKELSLVQSVSADNFEDVTSHTYAIGFASENFIILNLKTETKVVKVPCGGWRRPHSHYLGDVPELRNCFAYVKDEIIYIHRNWVPDKKSNTFPQNMHTQFHGREIHALLFLSGDHSPLPGPSHAWIATGCEDGTVRLSRYSFGSGNWSASKLLGEHIGGSAVRSICFVSKMHIAGTDVANTLGETNMSNDALENRDDTQLLISVGAKRVLTSWMLRKWTDNKGEAVGDRKEKETGNYAMSPGGASSTMSFQWLSTDMPKKYTGFLKRIENTEKIVRADKTSTIEVSATSQLPCEEDKRDLNTYLGNEYENDWRYLAVTAFLVKFADSRFTVCFVVISCSDATLALRALVLPSRIWFDVATLTPIPSPVLSLQHVVIPICLPYGDKRQVGSAYILISGSTDGNIIFWDLTASVEAFMQKIPNLRIENSTDCQRRPPTGRGSQGGRQFGKRKNNGGSVTEKAVNGNKEHALDDECKSLSQLSDPENKGSNSGVHVDDLSFKRFEVPPLHILNSIHQSGVNCLHVSERMNPEVFGFQYDVVSGGDDQALHYLRFDLTLSPSSIYFKKQAPDNMNPVTESEMMEILMDSSQNQRYRIRYLYNDKIASAHSSALKGIWTDGTWVFSTGLDQRVRCWHVEEHGKLTEHGYLVISVPEPETLDARYCGENYYQVVVAGRGMQMVEFRASHE